LVAEPPPTLHPGGNATKLVAEPPPIVHPAGNATKLVAEPPPTDHPEYLLGKLTKPAETSMLTANGAPATLIAAVPVLPSLVAVIVTGPPAAMPVTSPVDETVAIAPLLVHVTSRPVSTFPAASVVVAVSCTVAPTTTIAVAGVTVTDATGTVPDGVDGPVPLPPPHAFKAPHASMVATAATAIGHFDGALVKCVIIASAIKKPAVRVSRSAGFAIRSPRGIGDPHIGRLGVHGF
jgi:hypothetical protein